MTRRLFCALTLALMCSHASAQTTYKSYPGVNGAIPSVVTLCPPANNSANSPPVPCSSGGGGVGGTVTQGPSGSAAWLTMDSLADAALGTPADTAWGGTGSGSTIALQKALYGALQADIAVNASYSTFTSMTPGSTALSTPTRGLETVCTASGNVVVQAANGNTLSFPVIGYAGGADIGIRPLAIVQITSATTATCTFTGLN